MLLLNFLLNISLIFASSNTSINTNLYKNDDIEAYDLIIEVNSDTSDIELNTERLEDSFNIVNRGSSSSTSISIVNSSMSKKHTTTLTLSIVPKRANETIVPPVLVNIDGKSYKTKTLKLSNATTRQTRNNRGFGSFGFANNALKNFGFQGFGLGQDDLNISSKDIIVKAIINKKDLVVGEQAVLSYYIYKKKGVQFSDIGLGNLPKFNGFLKEELLSPKNVNFDAEQEINGKLYQRALIAKYLIYPVKAGTLTIDPLIVNFVVGTGGFFSMGRQIKRRSKEIKVIVKALPQNVPNSFTGAVGEYSISTDLEKKDIKVGEDTSLKITVSGRGNLELLDLKDIIKFPDTITVYDSKGKLVKNKLGLGKKEFKFVIVPQESGNFNFGPWDFSYFDTKTRSFKTLKIGPINLNVRAGLGQNTTNTKIDNKKKENIEKKEVKKDDFVNKTSSKMFSVVGLLFAPAFWIILIILLVIIIFVVIKLNNKGKKNKNKILKATMQNTYKEFKNENYGMALVLLSDAIKLLIAIKLKLDIDLVRVTLLEFAKDNKDKINYGEEIYQLAKDLNTMRFSGKLDKDYIKSLIDKANDFVVNIKK